MRDEEFKFAVLAEKVGYDKPLFLHNLSLGQLCEDIVIPFEEGKPFFIDGVPVRKDELEKIKITKQSDRFIESTRTCDFEFAMLGSSSRSRTTLDDWRRCSAKAGPM